jgi:hypothetical protein
MGYLYMFVERLEASLGWRKRRLQHFLIVASKPHMNPIDYAMVYLNANRHYQLVSLFKIFADCNDRNRSVLFIILI